MKPRSPRADFSHIVVPEGAKLIPLTQGRYALVDEEDYERVSQYNWCAHKSKWGSYYAVTKIKYKTIRMHRFVTGTERTSTFVDHWNGDQMDNRKKNLRPCTNGQNQCNVPGREGTSSKYKGVHWSNRQQKWMSNITFEGVCTYLGSFDVELDAAKAYDTEALKLHGDFARLNVYGNEDLPF